MATVDATKVMTGEWCGGEYDAYMAPLLWPRPFESHAETELRAQVVELAQVVKNLSDAVTELRREVRKEPKRWRRHANS